MLSLANFSLKFPSLDGRGEGRVKIPVVSPTYPPPSRGRNQGQKNAKLKNNVMGSSRSKHNLKSKMSQTARKKYAGFTLLELLLGLSLFSVIAVCVYSTFWAGMNLSRRSERSGGSYREIRWALELMVRDMENTVPYDFSNSYPEKRAFEGGDNKITFMTVSEGGLKAVSYYLVPPEETKIHRIIVGAAYRKNVDMTLRDERERRLYCLVREEREFVDSLEGNFGAGGTSEVIATNIEENGLKFSFGYSKEGEDRLSAWKDKWQNPYPPLAVRIEMNFFVECGNKEAARLERRVFVPQGSLGKEAS